MGDPTEAEWAEIVAGTLAEHPEFAAATVRAMQEGILAANGRLRERIAVVSLGLSEALRTKPNHVRRNRQLVIKAIEASTVHPTPWSKDAIAKEQEGQK